MEAHLTYSYQNLVDEVFIYHTTSIFDDKLREHISPLHEHHTGWCWYPEKWNQLGCVPVASIMSQALPTCI